MKKVILGLLTAAFLIGVGGCKCPFKKCEKISSYDVQIGSKATVTPVPRPDKWWTDRHEAIVKRVAQGNVDLLMIGDSITHGWEGAGKAMWEKYYSNRNAVNMGFSGDQTQHVLWRLDNGEIKGITPKLAVIMIGTNNSGSDSAKDIADGIIAICQKLRRDLPQTKILLLAIFPRADRPNQMPVITETNEIIKNIADNKHIYFLDINKIWLNADGSFNTELMKDKLHPGQEGYVLWAEAQEPMIKKLMK
ncbi:MAG: hypothetical protein A2Y07_00595 [Planctomycetes bacterium GWF2_50_10]|nr:MAG: hypothetical protein A2Y07_00595 [Planctomycetes bacterium GWF2_50_10]